MSTQLLGADCSHYQGVINWDEFKKDFDVEESNEEYSNDVEWDDNDEWEEDDFDEDDEDDDWDEVEDDE